MTTIKTWNQRCEQDYPGAESDPDAHKLIHDLMQEEIEWEQR